MNVPYLLALHSIDGFGPIRLKAILEYFKDPKLAWQANGQEFLKIGIPKNTVDLFLEKRKKLEPQTYAKFIQDSNIKWITIFDPNYPKLLAQIYDPPIVVYYKGDINWNATAIAVVGTRKMTGYGKVVTEQLVKDLVSSGLTVVSGLAKGVDAQAHWTTIRENGKTIAVLGGGLNEIYPPENRSLAEKIISGFGVIVSEFPPDYPSLPGNFPSRNRIISGLSLGVLVTEAASGSGSLITAREAIEQGREVFAVPGPITSQFSRGPLDLIKMGARPVSSGQEILEEFGININQRSRNLSDKSQNVNNLSKEEMAVVEILENETKHIDEIGRQLNIPVAKISAILLKMEISGLISNMGGGMYTKL